MTREWITDFNKMGFTEEEKELALKVFNADPSSTLYFDGDKNYLWEDEREDNYFTKETLLENLAITFEEWKKEGMFDEEEEAPAYPWLKVLEERVEEWQERYNEKDYILKAEIKRFKAWVGKAEEDALLYDTEMNYNTLKSVFSAYKFAWQSLGKAKDELAAYKEAMNY